MLLVCELHRIRVFLTVPKVLSLSTASGIVPDLMLHKGCSKWPQPFRIRDSVGITGLSVPS